MKQLTVLAFLLSACATSVPFPDPAEPAFIAPLQTEIMEVETEVAALPIPTEFVPGPERTNWLLLGGDYRAHREGTGWGNKTDVIVLVSVLETDPMQVTVVQFPRNLYAPFSMGDVWLFGVWDEFGWQGLHQYFQEVFGVTLQGVHYIDMDGFVKVVDGLGGDGEAELVFLRDNENNWELGSYDAGERVFAVLRGLWEKGISYFLEDPVAATNIVYSQWGDLFETDLGNIEQLYWLFRMGWRVRNAHIQIGTVQLEEPIIERGDTPIMQNEQPARGMVAAVDLRDWMQNCVLNWVDDGSCE